MNNFNDSWSVIFDDRAKPLLGKIEFCESNTTDTVLKAIFDIDGNAIQNPVYCNGVPSTQVMLSDGDYTVRFYRYIGAGNMESDKNEDSWLLYKTELVSNGVSISNNEITISTVATVEDLMQFEGMNDGDAVHVLGYYNSEDCPSRYFVWHESGNFTNDGGIVIKSYKTTSGAWLMKIPGSYIDVRWFGDIASNSSSATTSNLGQRTKAAIAANKYKKDLYFPSYGKGNSNGYYMFDGSNTVSVTKDIICDDGVRFVVKPGTTGTSIVCHELHKCEKYLFVKPQGSEEPIGGYSIVADWINTSWFTLDKIDAAGARVGYVIDYLNTPLRFEDTKIKFVRDGLNIVGCRFTNCLFLDCDKNIDKECHFYNMEIKQSWFADDFNFVSQCSFSGCKMLLDNFYDADTYIKMKNKQNETDYGDLGEQSINNADVYPGGTIENFYGSITLNSAGNYEIHNASVTINGVNANTTLNLVDCWTTLGGNYSVCGGLVLRRGTLSGSSPLQMLGAFNLYDADVSIYLKLYGLTGFTIDNCKIYSTIEILGHNHFYIINNIFETNSKIEYAGDADVMYGTFKNNIIKYGSLGWHYSSNIANTNVGIAWIGNHSDMASHFIKLERTNFKARDIEHTYVYKDNTGLNTLQQEWTTATTGKVRNGITSSVDSNTICYLSAIRGNTDSLWDGLWQLSIGFKHEGVIIGKDIKPVIFAVGTIVKPILDLSVFTYDNYDDYLTINGSSFTIWNMPTSECSLELISGYTWQLFSGSQNAFRCHGKGNLSGTPIPDKTLNFKVTVKNERFI